MPFRLHPSGFCSYYSEFNNSNLLTGCACRYCKRVAGHSTDCPDYKPKEPKGKSSRPSLYNASSVLWCKAQTGTNFYTFTLPSLENGTYQRSVDCPETGDIAIAEKFSKVLEAWSVRTKRAGRKLSYTWVSEAQMKRQKKFGGVGDIHYHLVASELVKDAHRVTDREGLEWLQALWCSHIGVNASNCLDVDFIPPSVNSIPAYLSKYMGKGAQRKILSRQFAATRDLTKFKPITLVELPDVDLIASKDLYFESGFEMTAYYFNTQQVLETFGHHMEYESKLQGSISNKHFTPRGIANRAAYRAYRRKFPQLDMFDSVNIESFRAGTDASAGFI